VVSVKAAKALPKGRLLEAAQALQNLQSTAPIAIGQSLAEDFLGTGIALLATSAATPVNL
jgi:CxxC motif-containing protein